MKKNTITLYNDFHNTEVVLLIVERYGLKQKGFYVVALSEGQTKKAKKALCGISNCTCSDSLGMRSNICKLSEEPDRVVFCESQEMPSKNTKLTYHF